MKVLRVIPSMDPRSGGPCQGIRNSVAALQKLGIATEVVCLDDPQAEFIDSDSFPIVALGASISRWKYPQNLLSWLKENMPKYDAVIVHGLWLFHSHAALRAFTSHNMRSKARRPTLYVMPHGMLDPWFQEAKGRRLKSIRNAIYWQLIEKKVVNAADGILFTCAQEKLLARGTFPGYAPKREFNIGYGIVEPPAACDRLNDTFFSVCPQAARRPFLLFLSRIHPKKGTHLLVDAYLSLKNQILDLPSLVIAGPGLDTAYGRQIQMSANGDECVHFTGMLTGDAKWGAFYACDAFVLPSHQENFGIAVVEALACSKPVLISDQVNIWKEILMSGGGLIENDTLEGTRSLLVNYNGLTISQKKDLSKNARKAYEKYFSIDNASLRMKEVLESSNEPSVVSYSEQHF